LAIKLPKRISEAPMKKLVLFLVVASLFMASPVLAYDGRTLKHYCEVAILSEKAAFSSAHLLEDFNRCVSSVNTVFNTISNLERFVNLKQPNAFSCVPDKIELIEKVKLVYTYIEEHPDKINRDSIILIMEAFAEAFPCPETQPPK